LQGVPISLTDTAGFREAGDKIERIGIERTRRAMADADLLVVVVDGSSSLQIEDQEVLDEARNHSYVVAINKTDLPAQAHLEKNFNEAKVVHLSALTEEGMPDLTAAILEPFGRLDSGSAGFLVTDSRHHDLLVRAISSLDAALESMDHGASEELVLSDLHNTLRFLGAITGETTSEDILSEIFSTFCIGK
jgi:tRNA modification GTPase